MLMLPFICLFLFICAFYFSCFLDSSPHYWPRRFDSCAFYGGCFPHFPLSLFYLPFPLPTPFPFAFFCLTHPFPLPFFSHSSLAFPLLFSSSALPPSHFSFVNSLSLSYVSPPFQFTSPFSLLSLPFSFIFPLPHLRPILRCLSSFP